MLAQTDHYILAYQVAAENAISKMANKREMKLGKLLRMQLARVITGVFQ
jgi:hypothetical protein